MRFDQRQTHWHLKKLTMAQSSRCLIHSNKNASEINMFSASQTKSLRKTTTFKNHSLYTSSFTLKIQTLMTTWFHQVQTVKDPTHSFMDGSGARGAVGRVRLNHNWCILTWKCEKQFFRLNLQFLYFLYFDLFLSKSCETF